MDLKKPWNRADEKHLNPLTKKIIARVANDAAETAIADALLTLAATLDAAVQGDVIDDDTAAEIYGVWRQNLARARGELIECGCKSMLLSPEIEYGDVDGIRHSPNWCDIVPTDKDFVDMQGLEDPDQSENS